MAVGVGVTLVLQTLVHAIIWVGAWWSWGLIGSPTAAWLSLIWHFVSRDCADLVIKATGVGLLPRRGAVIVTGAGRGLGKAAVLSLIRDGYHVVAAMRDLAQAEELKKQVAKPERLHAVAMDVASDESIRAGRDKIKTWLNQASVPLVGLINNAGVATHGPIEAVPISEYNRVNNVNVNGIVRCVKAFLPLLRESASASASASPRIVNISSVGGFGAAPFFGVYALSKYSLEGLNDALRREIASQGVHVVCVEPGFVESDMPEKLGSGAAVQEGLSALSSAGLSSVYSGALTAVYSSTEVHYQRGKVSARAFGDLCSIIMQVNHRDLHTRYLVGSNTLFIRFAQRFLPDSFNDALIRAALSQPTANTNTNTNKQR